MFEILIKYLESIRWVSFLVLCLLLLLFLRCLLAQSWDNMSNREKTENGP